MKKSAFAAALLLLGVVVSGCPVYDGNDIECFDDLDCPFGSVCDPTGLCVSEASNGNGSSACNDPDDCGINETCNRSGSCVVGDCHFGSVGCVRGFECSGASGRWQCVREGQASSNGGASAESTDHSGGEPSKNGGAAGAQ